MNRKGVNMKSTLTRKIIESHLVSGQMKKGQEIKIRIDHTLTQDATGTMCYLEFEALGLDSVKNELAVSYVDHNTVQVGYENFDDHEYLRTVAKNKGVIFSHAGNGICHQVQLESFSRPGKTLLGSDSHTPTSGGIAEIAIGAGGLDVALAMAGLPFNMIYPKVVGIKLSGRLNKGVSAKDVILTVIEHFTVKGNVNSVFEYFGEGVKTLSVPERATICNMGAECGVTFSIFPSDERTLEFLKREGREDEYIPLASDEGAQYDEIFSLDLSSVHPMIALPHSPGNVKRVKDMEGLKVDQVLIGSCTNSSYEDLYKSAKILESHVACPDVSLAIAPGSRQVFKMALDNGLISQMVSSGARILESACGFCIGNHQSPGTDSVSLRTNNRNFEGRSGTKSAKVYLVSPETAALSAINGYISDPEGKYDFSSIEVPERYYSDMSTFIFPDGEKCEIKRGPNIGNPPLSHAPDDEIDAVLALKVGDKITTDHIMPAGSRLKYRSNIKEYSKYVFEPVDETFSSRCLENKEKGRKNIIVAGLSYGQGSSREHAAICPMYLGVQAVVALSIERIHQANLCNFGILPLIFKNSGDYEKIEQGDEILLKSVHESIRSGNFTLIDRTKNIEIPLVLFASEEQKEMLLLGGRLNMVKGI